MNVLFISVHADDETLGCGGTILKHKNNGDKIYWLIATSPKIGLGYSLDYINKRDEDIKLVSKYYGFSDTYNLDFPTTKLHIVDFSEIITKISSVIQEIKPTIVYTVNRSDIHTDHQIISKAVTSCTKSFRNPFIKRILMYECLSETEAMHPLPENFFYPNSYSDITNFLEQKLNIMKIYNTELQELPLPRNLKTIEALALFRGTSIGVKYAEAFMIVRDIF